jgi:hypothetical protein
MAVRNGYDFNLCNNCSVFPDTNSYLDYQEVSADN